MREVAAIRELQRRCLIKCLNQSFNLSLQYYSTRALGVYKTEMMHSFNRGISERDLAMAIKDYRGDPKMGVAFHSIAVLFGFIRYPSVVNSLMSKYCKAGKFDNAFKLFRSMDKPSIVFYNTILSGFPNSDAALCFAANMHANGVVFSPVTYTTALSFCVDDQGFLFGFQLHSNILKSGFGSKVFINNSLITLYSRWGRIFEAEKVFYEMPTKDHVSWNAMLCGYSQAISCGIETIRTFCNMLKQGVMIDTVSLTAGISACVHEKYLEAGKLLHGLSIKFGCGKYSSVCNLLMSAYAKCEVNGYVKFVFQDMAERNVFSWTTMISVFPDEALSLFRGMRVDGVYPGEVTFISLLHAITQRNMVNEGQMIHGLCLRSSFVSELHVSNSLISMYAKFESMGDAVKVFEELQYRDVISWNSLISGHHQNRLYKEAFEAFRSAISDTRPDQYTFGSILSAIGSAEAISLRYGRTCHSYLFKSGLYSYPIVSAALLNMYTKRRSHSESKKIFKEIVQKPNLLGQR